MTIFNEYLIHGNSWLFIPGAIVLGVLHGLEPGHSKTMMTAFIIAIRGTVRQALLLGLSATISHTVIIWVLAFIGLHYSSYLNIEGLEPYFQLATGAIIIGLALWMLYKTRRAQIEAHHHNGHEHHHGADVHHTHSHEKDFEFGDAHERAHALELEKHLENRHITTREVILFGLTGGLLPCPSAFAVLLLCLQLKKFTLGFALVFAFSLGLAITLVSVGIIAAVSIKHVGRRFGRFGEFARKAPYLSSVIMIAIGLLVALQGLRALVVQFHISS